MLHSNSLKNHKIENWTYANTSARTGATGFVAGDVGKLAYQTDTGYYYRLLATTPTWSDPIGAGGGKIEAFTYANAAARTGATGLLPGDVGKIAYQTDTGKYYRLLDDSPLTWSDPLNPDAVAAASVFIERTPVVVGTDNHITFSSIPQTHRHLRVRGRLQGPSFEYMVMQVNGVTSADYWWQEVTAQGTTRADTSANAATEIRLAAANGDPMFFVLDIPFYSQTTYLASGGGYNLGKGCLWRAMQIQSGLSRIEGAGRWGNGNANALAAVTSLKFFSTYAGSTLDEDSRLTLELTDPL
jgi:hypothetical protein